MNTLRTHLLSVLMWSTIALGVAIIVINDYVVYYETIQAAAL